MKRFLPPLVLRNKYFFAVVTIALLAALAVTVQAWLALGTENLSSVLPATSRVYAAGQGSSGRERVETEVITILPTGFNPSQITRPTGRFLILFDNRSGLDEVTLRLNLRAGQTLREHSRTKEDLIIRQVEDLPPGEYLLAETNHPEWVCHITITPR